jgi:hypothetical protein
MPPGFLSPVSWMNTASLLQPFERMMAREDMRQAVNLHVYTEMWRTLGLGLDRPPEPDTFIGRLYAHHTSARKTRCKKRSMHDGVRSRTRGAVVDHQRCPAA